MKKYRLGNDVFDISPEEETEFLKQNPDAILVSGPNETDRSQNNQLTTEDLDWINNTDGNLKDNDPKKFQEIKNKLLGGSNAESNLFGPLGASPTGNFFDKKTNKVFFRKNINDTLGIKYIPNAFQVYYEAVCNKSFSILNSFGKILGGLKSIPLKTMGRYKHAKRVIRREIDALLKNKKSFLFTNETYSGERQVKPYKQSTRFGPYNYPVKLKVDREVDIIKDLVVVTTGSFVAGSSNKVYDKTTDKIVYVSPHVEKTTSGICTTSTGVNYLGNTSITTGQNLSAGFTSEVSINYITSEDFTIPSGSYLNGSGEYKQHLATASNTG